MRFAPAALLGVPRLAKVDVELRGVRFPAGSLLVPLTRAANRDPVAFDDPDVFDITRAGRRPVLTYGAGIHHCLGVALARAEIQEALGPRPPPAAAARGRRGDLVAADRGRLRTAHPAAGDRRMTFRTCSITHVLKFTERRRRRPRRYTSRPGRSPYQLIGARPRSTVARGAGAPSAVKRDRAPNAVARVSIGRDYA